jgi:hypothetical protein
MSDMAEWVAWYESQGLTYFPLYGILNGVCRCKDGAKCGANTGKHPVYKWKGQPSRKPRDTDNVAVSTNDLVVIDFDGENSESELSEFPRTFTTSTGHGFHLWYRADPTKQVKSFAGWRHKVDVRAVGGLVVAPPSRHRSGSVYRHVAGDAIQPVPRWLLDELPEKGSSPSRRLGYEVVVTSETTHPVMQPLAGLLVSEMAGATENRNQTLFRLGCRYFEFASTGLLGADTLSDLFGAAVGSGLTAEEVERTLNSARKSV